ncbi:MULTISPECIES: tetratricopeptide repeat protein [Helicobacter]|uniref:Beta-lactamase n=1 Tax=Helicobacter typhlonius TaxID=76936 RepID=A0A099UD98_9HELI|nr:MULTISPECIES: tetratricopeptide repeat protein [Helicobacter]TLD77991.1 hypothetical protein LS75_008440 [Helicobacter typhlonius]TLD87960.1 hypothetical protein LS67_005865 [Helicobacter sp. MIT 03-1616]CUU39977.1 Hypothetical protein BN2458_PEG1092 [Helicobacter typhlonius]
MGILGWENIRIDYDFLFILTDLKTGRVAWDDEGHISKVVKKAQAGNFKRLGEGTCDGGDVVDCNKLANEAFDLGDYEKSYEFFNKACKLGNNTSCDSAKYTKKKHKELKRINRDWHFGFVLGGDVGIGTANIWFLYLISLMATIVAQFV